ncbi:N-acetyl sugar amidotransferase [Alphaproteobacteria bacterium]|nr:N-acetyl sugar amidotransferase [Alphaproteobacteria bacterium]
MSSIIYCKKCLFPNTKPDLFFNNEGICDACLSAKRKYEYQSSNAVDWEQREKEFEKILEISKQNSGEMYNCIVPVSGGKDSTWQAYAMKKIHHMKPLAVTFDQFDQTETGLYNLEVLRDIGVDHIHFTLNPNIVKKLVYKGFEIVGDPYWVNHVGIWTVPMHFANLFKAPLVVFGENPIFEYGGPEYRRDNLVLDKRWRQEFGGMRGFREEDMVDDEISAEDLKILNFPKDEDVRKNKILGTFYGYFFRWEPLKHTEFVKTIGWKPLDEVPAGAWMNYENCDMKYIDIRERVKFLKYGYGRATDQLCIGIRNKFITRKEAIDIVTEVDGKVDPKNIEDFCKYLNISLEKYNEIMDSFVNIELFTKNQKNEWVLKNNIL